MLTNLNSYYLHHLIFSNFASKMLPEYQLLLDSANKSKKENKTFFEKLKKIPVKELDSITNDLHEKAFEKIDCLKCANCCATTGPLLKNKDIQNLADHLKIKQGSFAEKYLKVDEDNDYVFKSMPCPFLKSDNCCSVYSARPNACRQFPHTNQRNIRSILPITYLNSMICPAVAYVVEGLKKQI